MLNHLNILQWKCTTTDKLSSAFSSKWLFSKEDKILIKNLRQLKGYTATRLRIQNQKLDKSTNCDNSGTNYYTNLSFC